MPILGELTIRLVIEGAGASGQANAITGSLQKLDVQAKLTQRSFSGLSLDSKQFATNLHLVFERLGFAIQGLNMLKQTLSNIKREYIDAGLSLQNLQNGFTGTAQDIEDFRIATARTVTDANLLKLSNQATDLGISLNNQKIAFALAEDVADRYATTVEGGFQSVIYASEGNERALKQLGIQKGLFNQLVDESVKKYIAENNIIDINTGKKAENIAQLPVEEQKRIRLDAVIKASGKTLQDATTKVQDNKDKFEALGVATENAKQKIGIFIGEGLIKLVEGFGATSKAATETAGYIGAMGKGLVDMLPVVAQLKIAFPGMFSSIIAGASSAGLYIAGIAAAIYTIYQMVKLFKSMNTGITADTPDKVKKTMTLTKEQERMYKDLKAGTVGVYDLTKEQMQQISVLVATEKQVTEEKNKQFRSLEQINNELSNYNETLNKIDPKNKEEVKKIRDKIDALKKEQIAAQKLLGLYNPPGALKKEKELDALQQIQKEYADITAKIEYYNSKGWDTTELLKEQEDVLIRINNLTKGADWLKPTKESIDALTKKTTEELEGYKPDRFKDFERQEDRRIKKEREIAAMEDEIAEGMKRAEEGRIRMRQQEWDNTIADMQAIYELAGLIGSKLGEGGNKFLQYIQLALQVAMQIAQMQKKGAGEEGVGFGDILGLIGTILPFFFLAGGGPARGGQPYVVGERGPELFVPDRSGVVLPNYMLAFLKHIRSGTDWGSSSRYMGGAVNGGGTVIVQITGELTEAIAVKTIKKGMGGYNLYISKK